MSKVTIKGFIYKCNYGTGYHFYHTDGMDKYGDLLVGPCEFEYEIPEDFNPAAAEVAMLEKKIDEVSDEYHKKIAALKGRINDLKCIEHSPAEQA
jgi:hypothetical protein